MTDALIFNGRSLKAVSFGSAISDGWYSQSTSELLSSRNTLKGFTAQMAYDTVAYAFRCVTKRAEECSRVPFTLEDESGRDVKDDPACKSLVPTEQLFFDLEVSRCVYGVAYAPIVANVSGYNVGLEWAASPSIEPDYDPLTQKVRWFYRQAPYRLTLQLNQLVYIWNRNYADENRPGLGETQVALGAASTLYALDASIARYLNAGAVPVFIVPEDPSATDEKIKKEQQFWNKIASGLNNSWRYVVARMTKDRIPVKVGSNMKEMEAQELSETQKKSIAEAHSIPPNVVDGTYKYATADSEYLGFVAGTIVPRQNQTFSRLNEQYYSRYGLKLKTQPKKMEIFQAAFLSQAQAVSQLVDEKPLTIDEARGILELGPKPVPATPIAITSGAVPVPLGAPQPIVAGGPQPISATAQASTPQPIGGGKTATSAGKPVPIKASPEAIRKAMAEWRDRAIKAVREGKKPENAMVSDIVPDSIEIVYDLCKCHTIKSVRAVFERHWPHDEPKPVDAVATLARATQALELAMEMSG